MKKIKIGVLVCSGLSSKGFFHPLRSAEFCEVYGIASRTSETARAFAEKNNIPRYYGSYDELYRIVL